MAAAAASAPPSIVRSPSRNGPVPRRHTKTANTRAEAAKRPHADTFRLIRALLRPRGESSKRGAGGCALTSTHSMTLPSRQAFPATGSLRTTCSLLAVPRQLFVDGCGVAGAGSEECGPEEQLGPREIGQFFLHG